MSNVQQLVSQPDTQGVGGTIARVPVDVLGLVWEFIHYPTSWVFLGGEWLPELARINFRDGLNGQADGNPNAARQHVMAKGATIIPPTHPKLGIYRNYRHTLPAFNPNSGAVGVHYPAAWDKPTMVGARTVRWDIDEAAWLGFRRHLVTAGIIEPIARVVAEAKIDAISNTIENLRSLPRNAQRDIRIEAACTLVADMTAGLDLIHDTFEADPVAAAPEAVNTAPRRRKLGAPEVTS